IQPGTAAEQRAVALERLIAAEQRRALDAAVDAAAAGRVLPLEHPLQVLTLALRHDAPHALREQVVAEARDDRLEAIGDRDVRDVAVVAGPEVESGVEPGRLLESRRGVAVVPRVSLDLELAHLRVRPLDRELRGGNAMWREELRRIRPGADELPAINV